MALANQHLSEQLEVERMAAKGGIGLLCEISLNRAVFGCAVRKQSDRLLARERSQFHKSEVLEERGKLAGSQFLEYLPRRA